MLVQYGYSYAETGRRIGRKNGDGVSALVKRFNAEGLAAIIPRHGGGPQPKYTSAQRARIVTEMARQPTAEADGTNSWSLVMLQKALRAAADGLPEVSTETISRVVHEAGYSWQANRTWCQTGVVRRLRKKGLVTVTDPDANAKKVIERAYSYSLAAGIQVWCEDEAGPYQTIPYAGHSWQPQHQPATYPHEYLRNGMAKLLTLFQPASGQVRVKGVTDTTNATLHPWLKTQLSEVLADLALVMPLPQAVAANRAFWESWREGLSVKATLSQSLPCLRLVLILDNRVGHKYPDWRRWARTSKALSVKTMLSACSFSSTLTSSRKGKLWAMN